MTLPKSIIIAGCLLCSASPVFSQDLPALSAPESSTEPEIGLDELLQRALQNNPQLPIARETAEAARQNAAALRSLPNPSLQVVPGFSGTSSARDEEIILAQPFDLFGQRRAQRRVLDAQTRVASAGVTLAERQLIIAVKNAATDLFATQEAENLARAQSDIARGFRDAANRKAELGDVPAVQAQRAQLELDRAENDLNVAESERLARRSVLNQLIGQAPETPLRVKLPGDAELTSLLRAIPPTPLGGVTPAAPAAVTEPRTTPERGAQLDGALVTDRERYLPALTSRADIVGAQAQLEANRANVAAIGRQRFPQFEVQARRDTVTRSGGSTALRAVVTVPLFDFGSIARSKKAAEAQVRLQEAQVKLLRSQAASQLETALVRLRQRKTTVERYRTQLVPQTFDLLRKTQVGFQQGASSYLEVLEAQRTARQVQTEYLAAIAGVRTEETALESALGGGMTPVGQDASPTPAPVFPQ